MKRPILIVTIGYIIGIIVGLYLNKSIVPLCIILIGIYIIYKILYKRQSKRFKLFSIKRYLRYLKIYINKKVILLIIISAIFSNTITITQNQRYEKIYNNLENEENIELIGIVISNREEKQYYNKYKVQVRYDNKKLKIYINTNKDVQLNYGDKIKFFGTYIKPEVQRNYKGFDYSKYLRQLKVYGTIKCSKVNILKENNFNSIFKISNNISSKVISNTNKVLKPEESSILLGLILGYKTDIDEQTQEEFKDASMLHILAISGMHITYVILGINIIFKNRIGKKLTNIFSIIILIFYMFITNFSSSITRAGIMGILMIFSKIIYRKNDIYTSISISLLAILIYNPFLIQNVGLQLSYGGVLGIVVFNKNILKFLKSINIKNKIYRYKIKPKIQKKLDKIKEIISISISVQIAILPIIICNMNTFNPYFLLSNFLLSIIIGPIIILGFIFIIIAFINIQIAQKLSAFIEIGINLLKFISKIGKLKYSKIYIPTLSLFSIIIYYIIVIAIIFIYQVYSAKKPNKTQIRIRNLIALGKIKLRENKKIAKVIIIFLFIFILGIKLLPGNLKIYFIDVGQGDSCLIVTPHNKTILIDGGGSVNSDFDVGENTLLPYILDRGFTKIDTIIISHFDNDHVGRNSIFIKRDKSRKCDYWQSI